MFKKVIAYLKDVRQEMSKVTWPTRGELWESTIIVLVLSGILALFIFTTDLGLSRLLKIIL
jgi:preprotein translocase subunit SecE